MICGLSFQGVRPSAVRNMTRAEIEAVVWVKRLSVTKITVERLQQFREWRRDPKNRRAYDEASRQLDAAREAGEVWVPVHPTLH